MSDSVQNELANERTESGGPTAPLRTAIIGAGLVSVEHLRFLHASSAAHLTAVCDLSEALARFAAGRYHSELHFTDYRRMLDAVKPDVVHVLTPPHTHVPIARDCLDAGAHVIVEKPVAPGNSEFRALWEFARARGRVLTEDQNYRFNDEMLRIESLVESGALGELREVEMRMALPITEPGSPFADENFPSPCHRLPAGALHDLVPHLCYLALRFLPGVERVSVAWTKGSNHRLFRYDGCDALIAGGGVHARLRFVSDQSPDGFSVTVRGSRGYVETDFWQPYMKLMVPRKGGKQLTPLINHWVNGLSMAGSAFSGFLKKVRRRTPLEGMQTFLRRTYEALGSGQPVPVSFEDMDGATALLDAMLAEENRIQ